MSKVLKLIFIIIVVAVIVTAAFVGYKRYHRSYLQESLRRGMGSDQSASMRNGQGGIPTGGDLCGGTGGNGQIIRIGGKMFTLKLNNGNNRIIYLTEKAMIKTSSGSATLANLNIGERVTLVGGPNPDGSFTAQDVFVCK